MQGGQRRIDLQLFAQEKTEDPTPRRRREARRKGQVAKSQELSSTLVMMTGILSLRYLLPNLWTAIEGETVEILTRWALSDWSVSVLSDLTVELVTALAGAFLPFFGVVAAMGLLAELGQSGFSTSTKPLEERLQGMNPISGLKRLVSRKSLFELAKGLLKLAGVGVAAYLTLRATIPALFNVSGQPFERSILEAGGIIWDLLLKTGGVLIFLAAADYAYQRWEFEKSLRMSKEEVEKEVKETEGDPQLKARRRSQQRDLARSQMLEEIEDAEVVIANPTHFAVALGYNHHEDPAPVVLAKGRGYLALRIRELAEEHDVPVMEEPAVAQTLYKTAEVGQFIPSEMYEAVAEILALVWKMTGRIPDADADSAT